MEARERSFPRGDQPNEVPAGGGGNELTRSLLRLQHEIEHLARLVDEFAERVSPRLDVAAWFLAQLQENDNVKAWSGEVPKHRSLLRRQRMRQPCCHEYATKISWDEDASGGGEVSIDGRKSFHLRPQLMALLQGIADKDRPPASDGLVAWRPSDELAKWLAKRTGRKPTPRQLSKLLSRLGAELGKNCENRLLIESNRRGSMRFRLRVGQAQSQLETGTRKVSESYPPSPTAEAIPCARCGHVNRLQDGRGDL